MPPRIGPKRPLRLYVAEWREHRGLTQQQMADRLGTSDVTVSRWETGARKIDDERLPRIIEKTGIALSELRPDLAALMHSSERG